MVEVEEHMLDSGGCGGRIAAAVETLGIQRRKLKRGRRLSRQSNSYIVMDC